MSNTNKQYAPVIVLLIAAIAVMVLSILLFGCDVPSDSNNNTADAVQTKETLDMMSEAQRQVPMPDIVNWTERRNMRLIYELRDQEDLVTYAYITNLDGDLIYLGRCIGYGIPYSTQYTNPVRMEYVDGGEYGAMNPYLLNQPDPNGLFMPEGLAATWLMMLDPDTDDIRPVYVEQELIVSPFPLKAVNISETQKTAL